MSSVTRDDILSLLAVRHEMVEHVCDGIFDKQRIGGDLDVSRPTVDRAFREMENLGLLSSTGTTYELTRFGRLCCETCDEWLSALDEMVDFAAVLSHLPEWASLDDRILDGSEVIHVDTYAPLSPISEVGTFVAEADRIEGYSNAILPHYVEFFHRRVLEEEMEARVVLSANVAERAVADYREQIEDLVDAAHFELAVTPESLPYGFVVIDGQMVGVSIRDRDNRLQGALVNREPAAIEWATEHLETLSTAGEQIESLPADFPVGTD